MKEDALFNEAMNGNVESAVQFIFRRPFMGMWEISDTQYTWASAKIAQAGILPQEIIPLHRTKWFKYLMEIDEKRMESLELEIKSMESLELEIKSMESLELEIKSMEG